MSVLGSPQGVPERVWSLVGGLAAIGGTSSRETLDRLINPGFKRDGMFVQTKDELAVDAVGAATSLKLVNVERGEVQLGVPSEIGSALELADIVHDRLTRLPEDDLDRVLLDAYAWLVAESDRRDETGWIYEKTGKDLADDVKKGLHANGAKGMNSVKLPAWRRWLSFIGLSVPLPIPNQVDFPSPAARIGREIARSDLKPGAEVSARDFLFTLSTRMPYLDGGSIFRLVCERIQHNAREQRLSPLFSIALRDLHDEGVIRLRPRGDSGDAIRLAEDPTHEIQTFTLVQLGSPEGGAE